MKEHVIIMRAGWLGDYEAKTINKWLDAGWTVKHVAMSCDNNDTTVIFVLQHGDD